MGRNLMGNFLTIYAHDILTLFIRNVIEKKTRWFNWNNKTLFKMAFKHVFYFLSFSKNPVNTNANCLIQWSICGQQLNVKRCHKKIWILIKDIFTKWKRIFDSKFIDYKLLQYWCKNICNVVIASTNCWQNWTEWGYVVVISCTLWTLHIPYITPDLLRSGFKDL